MKTKRSIRAQAKTSLAKCPHQMGERAVRRAGVWWYILGATALLMGCDSTAKDDFRLFNVLEGSETNLLFNNIITESDTLNPSNYFYIYNGAGVALADVNKDGLVDVFFGGNMVSSRLYLNKGGLKFEDITDKAGVATDRWCTGVSVVDINTDGWLDFYVSVADRNYTEKGRNLLFVNNGDSTFTESAEAYGLNDPGYSTQAAFFDYDLDGDLDLYLLTNGIERFPHNNIRPIKAQSDGISTDKLFRNNGDQTFTDVSEEAGITIEGYGLGIAIVDVNQDGYADVYCANDFITNDLLYINNGDGTFTNRLQDFMRQTTYNGMGIDAADFNNDGLVDIAVVDMLPEDNKRQKSMIMGMNYDKFQIKLGMGYHPQFVRNTLQLNNGNGSFSEVGRMAGIFKTDWSWAPLFVDVDNDGWKDLFISNGYGRDVTDLDYIVYGDQQIGMFGTKESRAKQRYELVKELPGIHVSNYFYRNEGDLNFSDKSTAWGIHRPSYSNGCAFGDLDNDGDVDLVINNINESPFIYENRSELAPEAVQNNYLRLRLKGDVLNPQGLGALVTVKSDSLLHYHEHYLMRGYKSTMENVIHVGLGKRTHAKEVEVVWPDGKVSRFEDVSANQEIEIRHEEAVEGNNLERNALTATLFEEVDAAASGLNFVHQENGFVDFKQHPLLQQMYSRNGPGMAVGDVDGNGWDDLYIGGALNHQGAFLLQSPDGTFTSSPLEGSESFEDLGALFFDADGDADLDLYVVSGGAALAAGDTHYQDRLYINDGAGAFQWAPEALPQLNLSGSCIAAADYDKDGDLDVFVGGRILPDQYPEAPASALLNNIGGQFEQVQASDFEALGLITSAIWTDFDNDNWVDLIVAGEWMPITFFKNDNGRLVNVTSSSGLAPYKGLWNSLAAGDFDQDGDMDYLAGNLGLNSRLKASTDEPVTVLAKDFDANGSYDPIMTYYLQGESYPLHSRDALISQVVGFKGRFRKYSAYGQAKADDLFTRDELAGSKTHEVTHLQSSIVWNLGNGHFKLEALPRAAQLAPTYGIHIDDFNGDQHLDALLVGNLRCTELMSGYYDASVGTCLLGDGKGGFKSLTTNESGLYIDGDAKGIAELLGPGGRHLLIVYNDGPLKVLRHNASRTINVPLQAMDAFAIVHYGDHQRKIELPYGSGYLSQSSRSVSLAENADKLMIHNYQGKIREVDLNEHRSPDP